MNSHRTIPPTLFVVIPCYNEELCLSQTTKQLSEKLSRLITKKKISSKSRIVYIDDGSKDETWKLIEGFDKYVVGLKLSRNRGHQNALLAGLLYSKDHSDITISMDADLQDDIDVIDKMIKKYNDGSEIVYGVRSSRKKDSFFKRHTAQAFYKFMNWLGAEIIYNSADCRLMSRRALCELAKYDEVNLFLRGIVPLIGFKTSTVEYERAERLAGESKYPLKKMLSFAWDGITSFSIKPIRFVLTIGLFILAISLLVLLYSVIMKIIGHTVDGWTFIICSIWILGGIQMLSIGLIGEYVGKTYSESKRRPRYVIEKITGSVDE